MKNPKIPYKETFILKNDLPNVECWNFSGKERHVLTKGTLIRLEHVYDSFHTTCSVVDETGKCIGIILNMKGGERKRGYRFIVKNKDLGHAFDFPVPEKTADIVGDIIAYENDEMTDAEEEYFLSNLEKTGLASIIR